MPEKGWSNLTVRTSTLKSLRQLLAVQKLTADEWVQSKLTGQATTVDPSEAVRAYERERKRKYRAEHAKS